MLTCGCFCATWCDGTERGSRRPVGGCGCEEWEPMCSQIEYCEPSSSMTKWWVRALHVICISSLEHCGHLCANCVFMSAVFVHGRMTFPQAPHSRTPRQLRHSALSSLGCRLPGRSIYPLERQAQFECAHPSGSKKWMYLRSCGPSGQSFFSRLLSKGIFTLGGSGRGGGLTDSRPRNERSQPNMI